jgi:serine/threonine protein kinase
MIPVLPGYNFIEALYEGVNTLIYRASKQLDQTFAIVKALKAEYPSLEELTRLRHEYKISQRLVDIEGIVKSLALENHHNGLALILADFGAESLKKYLSDRQLSLTEFLTMSSLGQLVAGVAQPAGRGTGLGLSISQEIIVSKHGGQITCISAPGQGKEFMIKIPMRSHPLE